MRLKSLILAIEDTGLRPVKKLLEDAVPVAESRRKVVSRRAGVRTSQDRFKEQTVIGRNDAPIRRFPRKRQPNPRPNAIYDNKILHVHSKLPIKGILNHFFKGLEIP